MLGGAVDVAVPNRFPLLAEATDVGAEKSANGLPNDSKSSKAFVACAWGGAAVTVSEPNRSNMGSVFMAGSSLKNGLVLAAVGEPTLALY
jgi:hypothetical protein